MTGQRSLLAVDLGGTKVAAALVTAEGEIRDRRQEATRQEGPAAGVGQIAHLLRDLLGEGDVNPATVAGVGVGIPAVLAPETDHVVWAPNLAGWRDVALRPALAELLQLPVYVEYDGHTAVLGEWWMGAGRGYSSVVSVIVGTGIGGGMVLDGRLWRGRDRLAGAAGWFALASTAESKRGSARGHWEDLAAGPGIVRRAQSSVANYPESQLAISAGSLTAEAVFNAARNGDWLARQIVDETAGLIGLGVANIVSLVNPEIVILGGGVGSQGDLLLARVRQVVQQWAQPASAASVTITASQLGGDAGLLGAAYAAVLRAGSKVS